MTSSDTMYLVPLLLYIAAVSITTVLVKILLSIPLLSVTYYGNVTELSEFWLWDFSTFLKTKCCSNCCILQCTVWQCVLKLHQSIHLRPTSIVLIHYLSHTVFVNRSVDIYKNLCFYINNRPTYYIFLYCHCWRTSLS